MITTAVQRGNYVYVYGDKDNVLFNAPGTLQGYTSGSVSIKRADYVYVYDAKGHITASHYSK